VNHRSAPSNGRGPLGVLLGSVALSLVLTVIAAWAAGIEFWFMEPASTLAPSVDLVFNFITWISIFFFLLVVILMVVFMVQYRRRDPRQKATSDVTHNTPLELTWTIIPLVLVIAIFYVGMEGYINIRRAPAGSYEVHVKAQQWSWTFTHRSGCTETNVLAVPVGRPVRLLMESGDVLHALFIPAFRVKQDIVPGRIIDLWFEATKAGTYDLFCAEYCGKDHSLMHATVIAMEEEEFQAYMEDCAAVFDKAEDADLAYLASQRIYPRCASCHSLDGKDGTGPTWRGLWEKISTGQEVFTTGQSLSDIMGPGKTFETPEDYLRDSIVNPGNVIVERFTNAMPSFKGQLKSRELMAIIDFIKRLEEFDDKGKPKPGTAAAQRLEQAATKP
jgi:cytochrome c oxidase subunit 2